MKNSAIGWTDHTFNPWIGCTKVDELCAHCYAEQMMDLRYGRVEWGPGRPRSRTSAEYWKQPLRWNREQQNKYMERAAGAPIPHRPRVFCASLADWLDDDGVPIEWLTDLLALIRSTPNLDWLLLTKRPEKWSVRLLHAAVYMAGYRDGQTTYKPTAPEMIGASMAWAWTRGTPPSNVWIGTSVGTQRGVEKRVPELLKIPARVRFLSCEPLLEEISLRNVTIGKNSGIPTCPARCDHIDALQLPIHWIICGTESGPKRRAMNLDWARSLRDECKAAGVPFFLKQIEVGGKIITEPELDGTPHLDFPEVRT